MLDETILLMSGALAAFLQISGSLTFPQPLSPEEEVRIFKSTWERFFKQELMQIPVHKDLHQLHKLICVRYPPECCFAHASAYI